MNNDFEANNARMIGEMKQNQKLADMSRDWIVATAPYQYSYHFTWMGRPIIQLPQDIVALQEIIWKVQPKFIIETGVAHGGSLILSASMLQLIGGEGRVVGIDVDVRAHNRAAIEEHPMAKRIDLIEGSSIDEATIQKVRGMVDGGPVLVILDSNHTHEHVFQELKLYGVMTSIGSYCVVFDTFVEDMPPKYFADRPWDKGNSPKTAVEAFVQIDDRFVIDRGIDQKLLITVAPSGYLKRVK